MFNFFVECKSFEMGNYRFFRKQYLFDIWVKFCIKIVHWMLRLKSNKIPLIWKSDVLSIQQTNRSLKLKLDRIYKVCGWLYMHPYILKYTSALEHLFSGWINRDLKENYLRRTSISNSIWCIVYATHPVINDIHNIIQNIF